MEFMIDGRPLVFMMDEGKIKKHLDSLKPGMTVTSQKLMKELNITKANVEKFRKNPDYSVYHSGRFLHGSKETIRELRRIVK